MNLSIFNSLCYTAGWFWCVLFGINGQTFIAVIGALLLVLTQLYAIKITSISLYIQDVLLVLFSIPLGAFLEFLFLQLNVIRYVNNTSMFPPLWIVCLYPLFSLLLNHSLSIIKKNYYLAFLFGFLGAPFSYVAGDKLGGLIFHYPLFQSWMFIGTSWGVFLCLLTKIAHIIEKATDETLEDHAKSNIKLLYDGECPLCNKEICILRKKDKDSKINFVDISAKDYLSTDQNDLDYVTAMSQIHAIEDNGNILVGIPVFAAIYARCQLFVLSTLLRIPFLKILFNPLYKLFAYSRLWITGRKNINYKN